MKPSQTASFALSLALALSLSMPAYAAGLATAETPEANTETETLVPPESSSETENAIAPEREIRAKGEETENEENESVREEIGELPTEDEQDPENKSPEEDGEAPRNVAEHFIDVFPGAWYVEHIQWVFDHEIMVGYDNDSGKFGVGDTLKRAELAVLLANYAGADTSTREDTTGIHDVAEGGAWYTGAVNWAVENGIITGYDNPDGSKTFAPLDPVTREQAMVILARYAAMRGIDTSTSLDVLSLFPDKNKVASWAKNSVAWIVRKGVVTGAKRNGDSWIDPKRNILREEMAKMIRLTITLIEGDFAGQRIEGWVKRADGSWFWFSEAGEMAKSTWVESCYLDDQGRYRNNLIFSIINKETGGFLDIADDAKTPGASVRVQAASGVNSSKWKITSSSARATLNGGTNSNLKLSDRQTLDGQAIVGSETNNTTKWEFECTEGMICRIRSASSGLYLTASPDGTATLDALDETSEAQKWEFVASELAYDGFQNPSQYYQVSNESVTIKNQGRNKFGFRQESRISINATREECIETMITVAYEYLEADTPYKWDWACAPGVGVDCAGLVLQCLYATGMDLSTHEYNMNPWDHYYTSGHDQYNVWMRETEGFMHVPFKDRQRGDLIFYEGHVAIYLGNDKVMDAYPPKVRITGIYTHTTPIAVARPFI